jgi:hypothetical protein
MWQLSKYVGEAEEDKERLRNEALSVKEELKGACAPPKPCVADTRIYAYWFADGVAHVWWWLQWRGPARTGWSSGSVR